MKLDRIEYGEVSIYDEHGRVDGYDVVYPTKAEVRDAANALMGEIQEALQIILEHGPVKHDVEIQYINALIDESNRYRGGK